MRCLFCGTLHGDTRAALVSADRRHSACNACVIRALAESSVLRSLRPACGDCERTRARAELLLRAAGAIVASARLLHEGDDRTLLASIRDLEKAMQAYGQQEAVERYP